MMSIFGSTFGFLQPSLWLLMVPVTSLLVYAYLRRGRGARIRVASILILQKLEQHASSRKKFRPPLRFFLELLVLLLLVGGLAEFYRDSSGERIALLIDNSFSMSALSGGSSTDEKRLEIAKREALAYLDNLAHGTQVDLYVTSPRLHSITDGLQVTSQVESALENLRFVYAPDDLGGAIQYLNSQPQYSTVKIFTDKFVHEEQGELSEEAERISLRPVLPPESTSQLGNIAVAGLSFRRGSLKEGKAALLVEVVGYGSHEHEVTVTVEHGVPQGEEVKFLKIRSTDIRIAEGSTERAEFGSVSMNGTYRVSLRERSTQTGRNVVTHDDVAFITPEKAEKKVIFVSRISPEKLGVNQIGTVQFDHLRPEKYIDTFQTGDATDAEYPSAFIFHRFMPSRLPDANAMFVYPVNREGIIQFGNEVQNPSVTRWLESHPTTSYLNLPALRLKAIVPLQVPSWAKELIATTDGLAAFAGTYRLRRYIALGFEVFPYVGRESPILSVFTLNILKWLSDVRLHLGYQLTNSPLELKASQRQSAVYIDDGSSVEFLEIRSAESQSLLQQSYFPRPGLVRSTNAAGGEKILAVNFLDAEESNVVNPQSIRVPSSGGRGIEGQQEGEELLTRFIALIVLLLLLIDLLLIAKGQLGRQLLRT